jgi:hypothetical protein
VRQTIIDVLRMQRYSEQALVARSAEGPLQRWYRQKKAKDGEQAKRAFIGVIRKLALALCEAGVNGESFDAWRLFLGAGLERGKLDIGSSRTTRRKTE